MAVVHELLVLTLVNERPTYGYDIKQFLATSYLAHCTRISTPQVYAVLRNLQERGLVLAREERANNTPPRTVYTITDSGRETLSRLLQDENLVNQRTLFDFDTVLWAMGGMDGLSTHDSLAVIRRRRSVVEEQIEDCQRTWEHVSANDALREIARAICSHRRGYLEAERIWLLDLEKKIEKIGWTQFKSPDEGMKAGLST